MCQKKPSNKSKCQIIWHVLYNHSGPASRPWACKHYAAIEYLLLAAAACAEHLGAGGSVASLPPLGRAQVEGGRRGIDKEIKAVGCGAVIIYM